MKKKDQEALTLHLVYILDIFKLQANWIEISFISKK